MNDNIRHVKENRIAIYICTAVPDVKASYNTQKKKRTQTEGNSLNGLLDYFRTRWTHRKKYQQLQSQSNKLLEVSYVSTDIGGGG